MRFNIMCKTVNHRRKKLKVYSMLTRQTRATNGAIERA